MFNLSCDYKNEIHVSKFSDIIVMSILKIHKNTHNTRNAYKLIKYFVFSKIIINLFGL